MVMKFEENEGMKHDEGKAGKLLSLFLTGLEKRSLWNIDLVL